MTEANPQAPRIPYFKNDPFIVLLLGFVTCGLYLIYWNIKMAEVINAVVEKQVITPPVAIFSGCCFPVNLYFYYLVGQNLEVIGRKVGNPTPAGPVGAADRSRLRRPHGLGHDRPG